MINQYEGIFITEYLHNEYVTEVIKVLNVLSQLALNTVVLNVVNNVIPTETKNLVIDSNYEDVQR